MTEKVIRLRQSLNYNLADLQVGVMNILEDDAGRVSAHLAIYDPRTGKDDDLRACEGDEIVIGLHRFRVLGIDKGTFTERGWIELAPSPRSRKRIDAGSRRQPVAGRFDHPHTGPDSGGSTKRLIAYLRENMILDFQGDLTLGMLRELLRDDDSRAGRALLAKIVEDRDVNDMMIVLADCLLEQVQKAVSDDVIREQLQIYAES